MGPNRKMEEGLRRYPVEMLALMVQMTHEAAHPDEPRWQGYYLLEIIEIEGVAGMIALIKRDMETALLASVPLIES